MGKTHTIPRLFYHTAYSCDHIWYGGYPYPAGRIDKEEEIVFLSLSLRRWLARVERLLSSESGKHWRWLMRTHKRVNRNKLQLRETMICKRMKGGELRRKGYTKCNDREEGRRCLCVYTVYIGEMWHHNAYSYKQDHQKKIAKIYNSIRSIYLG